MRVLSLGSILYQYCFQSHLKSHEVTSHGAEKPFECEICLKGFVYAYQLKTHLAAHAAKNGERSPSKSKRAAKPREVDEEMAEGAQPGTLYQCSLCQQVQRLFHCTGAR